MNVLYRFKITPTRTDEDGNVRRAHVVKRPTWLGRLLRRQALETDVRRTIADDDDNDTWYYTGWLRLVSHDLGRALRKAFPRKRLQIWRPVAKDAQITPPV